MRILNLTLFFLLIFCLEAFGRDFRGAVQAVGDDISAVLMAAGPIALAVSAGAFYFSRNLGWSMFQSTAIGTILFAASSSLFTFLFRAFN